MSRSLHCIFSYDRRLGGAVTAGLNVAKYLADAGWPTEAVASYAKDDDVDYLVTEYGGLECHRVERSFPQRYYNSMALAGWLEANLARFDVVELHGVFVLTTWQAAQICRRLKKPYLVRSHGALDPFDLQKHAVLKKILGPFYLRPLLRNAAGVMCTTQMEADRLVTFGANPHKFVGALPVPVMPPLPVEASGEFRRRHGIPADAIVVLFMSRLDYKKGLQFLIPALAATKARVPSLWLVLAGTGDRDWLMEVDRLLAQHRLGAWTTRTGFVSGHEKQAALEAADLFALPSLNENFGIVIVEALQAGLPLLLSEEVYVQGEIVRGGAGIACQPSVSGCELALQQLLLCGFGLKAMGVCGRKLARDIFSPEMATSRTLDIYKTVLQSPETKT